MSRQTIPLGHILGIPIELDPSWFLIFVLVTWTLAVSYYPTEFTGRSVVQYGLAGAVTAVLLFASVVLHELGHSAVRAALQGSRAQYHPLHLWRGLLDR